jgi:hypothetical protein
MKKWTVEIKRYIVERKGGYEMRKVVCVDFCANTVNYVQCHGDTYGALQTVTMRQFKRWMGRA